MWPSSSTRSNGLSALAERRIAISADGPSSTLCGSMPQPRVRSSRIRRLVALSSTISTESPHISAGSPSVASSLQPKRAVNWNVLP